jgi:recombination protein RecA
MANAKKDRMDVVLKNVQKAMGLKDAPTPFARFGEFENFEQEVISFGVKEVDGASNIGGVPRGKMIEIFGPESSGKSLLTLFLIASAQRAGHECALLDVEQSFDPRWAAQHGVDVTNLVFSNDFASGEQALEYAYQLCKSGAFGIVVIDSTAALIPRGELEGSLENEARVGAVGKMMSQGCRKITKAIGETQTICVFVNQIRDTIGGYGNPETTPGGKALKFYSHQRLRVSKKGKRTAKEDGKDVVIGQTSRVTFVKNKTAVPFGQCEFEIVFDESALNPVVMLCHAAKSESLIKIYKGVFRIKGDVLNEKKNVDTGTTNANELAHWLIQNNHVDALLDALIEEINEDPLSDPIDEAILEMKTDPSKIVSPIDKVLIEMKSAESATEEEVGEDAKEVDPSEFEKQD